MKLWKGSFAEMPWCTHGVGGKLNKFTTVMEMEYYIIYIFNHDPFFVLDYGFLYFRRKKWKKY